MNTKHPSNREGGFEEVDELKDSEVPEMGDEDILSPKSSEDLELDTDLENDSDTVMED